MARIIELLRDGPRDRAAIACALKLREPTTASVLTAMEYRQIVIKEGNRYSLLKRHA
jgi:predicted transcriptional regulator